MSFTIILLRPLASVAPTGMAEFSQRFCLEGRGREGEGETKVPPTQLIPTAALCIEDNLWDLSILHRRAVVIPSRVTERKACFGSCCW